MKNKQTAITAFMKKSAIDSDQPPPSLEQQPPAISKKDATSSIVESNPMEPGPCEQQY